MMLVLTMWQKKASGHPTRAGEGLLDDPTEATFAAAVDKLLETVDPTSQPFQIVAQVGDSSRGVQLGQGWTEERVRSELWNGYQSLASVNG